MINLRIIRVYYSHRDWAGIDRMHRMIAWTWRGVPHSITI
jgi:hypothetical protein